MEDEKFNILVLKKKALIFGNSLEHNPITSCKIKSEIDYNEYVFCENIIFVLETDLYFKHMNLSFNFGKYFNHLKGPENKIESFNVPQTNEINEECFYYKKFSEIKTELEKRNKKIFFLESSLCASLGHGKTYSLVINPQDNKIYISVIINGFIKCVKYFENFIEKDFESFRSKNIDFLDFLHIVLVNQPILLTQIIFTGNNNVVNKEYIEKYLLSKFELEKNDAYMKRLKILSDLTYDSFLGASVLSSIENFKNIDPKINNFVDL